MKPLTQSHFHPSPDVNHNPIADINSPIKFFFFFWGEQIENNSPIV